MYGWNHLYRGQGYHKYRLHFARQDIPKAAPSSIPPVIPIVRAPDDPGIEDDPVLRDEFTEQLNPPPAQAGGWRGFLSRWGN